MLSSSEHWRYFWLVIALVLVAVLAFTLWNFLGTFVLGVFLYYASRPIYNRLRDRIRPPSLAAGTALTLLVLPVVLLFWYTATLALDQLGTIADLDLTAYQDLIAPYTGGAEVGTLYERLISNPAQLLESGRVREAGSEALTAAMDFLGVFLNGLFQLFIALAVAFYLLRDDERLMGWVRDTFDNETLVEYGQNVDRDLQTVFFGNILTALLTGGIGAIVFWLLGTIAPPEVGLPVPILLGLLVGIASLIPIVGMKIILIPLTLYLLVLAAITDPQLLWFPAVFFVVTTIVVDFIPDLLLRPYVSGRDLHVGLVMFAYILGPLLFGWYGLFLGPLLLVLIVHFGEIVLPKLVAGDTGDSPAATTTDGSGDTPSERPSGSIRGRTPPPSHDERKWRAGTVPEEGTSRSEGTERPE